MTAAEWLLVNGGPLLIKKNQFSISTLTEARNGNNLQVSTYFLLETVKNLFMDFAIR